MIGALIMAILTIMKETDEISLYTRLLFKHKDDDYYRDTNGDWSIFSLICFYCLYLEQEFLNWGPKELSRGAMKTYRKFGNKSVLRNIFGKILKVLPIPYSI